MDENNVKDKVNKALSILNRKWIPKYKCPVCGENQFSAADKIATVIMTNELGAIQIGEHIPAFVAVCAKCGYIHLFSLNVLLNQSREEK